MITDYGILEKYYSARNDRLHCLCRHDRQAGMLRLS